MNFKRIINKSLTHFVIASFFIIGPFPLLKATNPAGKSLQWPELTTENKPYTVRTSETGDKVFMIKDGTYFWLTTPKALASLGFNLGEEKKIKYSELINMKKGDPIREDKKVEKPIVEEQKPATAPVLGYRQTATLESFEDYND